LAAREGFANMKSAAMRLLLAAVAAVLALLLLAGYAAPKS
jgi:hypothetical protein